MQYFFFHQSFYPALSSLRARSRRYSCSPPRITQQSGQTRRTVRVDVHRQIFSAPVRVQCRLYNSSCIQPLERTISSTTGQHKLTYTYNRFRFIYTLHSVVVVVLLHADGRPDVFRLTPTVHPSVANAVVHIFRCWRSVAVGRRDYVFSVGCGDVSDDPC